MQKAKNGDTVKIHYTGTLENGQVFADSREQQPLEFTLGGGKIIPGIERGIIGMKSGETKTIEIPPEEAYGQRREDLLVEIPKSELPDNIKDAKGQRIQMQKPDGGIIEVTVTEVNENTVSMDANHPLAGQTLYFNLELVEIV